MKNNWEKDTKDPYKKSGIEEFYDFAPYPAKSRYRRGFRFGGFRVIDLKKHRLPLQILISLIILGIVFSLGKLDNSVSKAVENKLQYFLTQKETDLKPVWGKILQLADRARNSEWPTVMSLPTQETKAVITETPGQLSLTIPVSGQITTPYGWMMNPSDDLQHFHEGVDIDVSLGTKVKAAMAGRVVRSGEDKNLGGYVLLEHDQNYTYYAGLGETLVKPDQEINEGEVIGKVGLNRETDEPHLHFEFRERGKPVDPLARLYPDKEPGRGM